MKTSSRVSPVKTPMQLFFKPSFVKKWKLEINLKIKVDINLLFLFIKPFHKNTPHLTYQNRVVS